MKTESKKPDFKQLLIDAIEKPGQVLAAFRAFHNYSTGNQLLAYGQCLARGIEPGAISTFKGWESKGRRIRKGEKAIALCMPVTIKKEKENKQGEKEESVFQLFQLRNNWFVFSQTDGENNDVKQESIPDFSKENVLKNLGIEQVTYSMANGNCLGYASGKTIAINPVCPAENINSVFFHEVGHVVLGHTELSPHDRASMGRDVRELEAECVAMLCLASLDLPGIEYNRGYIQGWFRGDSIPEKSAQRIFSAVDKILKAGMNIKKEKEVA